MRHRLGAARVDLHGRWRADAEIDLDLAFASGELRLPNDVRIEGLGLPIVFPTKREIPPPTLQIGAHSSLGGIRVSY